MSPAAAPLPPLVVGMSGAFRCISLRVGMPNGSRLLPVDERLLNADGAPPALGSNVNLAELSLAGEPSRSKGS